jgi:hypothetical protein
MKETLAQADKNVSLVAINQKQYKEALNFTITTLLAQDETNVILVSLSESINEVLLEIPQQWKNKLIIVDATQGEKEAGENVYLTGGPGDLTGIQIGIEKAEKKLGKNIVIIFDAINALTIYNKQDTLGKFIHIFNNKVRLDGETALLFTIKDATEENLLELFKEFSDKYYDFSQMYITSIELAEELK